MAAYKAWKAFERRHAKRMGGVRLWRPDFGDSIPDGESATDVWDCKAYQNFSVISMFEEAERKYRQYNAGRRFHLALFACRRRGAGDFVLLKADDFEALLANQRTGRIVHDDITEEWNC